MYRRIVLICEVVLLASMAMGCTVCAWTGGKGRATSMTVTTATQTLDQGVSPTAVPTTSATLAPVSPTQTSTPAAPAPVSPTQTSTSAAPAPTPTPAVLTRTPVPSAVPHKPLDVLDSYRYHLVVEGVERGQGVRMTVDGAFAREPGALQLDMALQEGDAPAEITKLVRTQGRLYTHDPGTGGWIVMPDDEAQTENLDFVSLLIQELGISLDGLASQVVSAHEDVQGVDSTHYTVDAQDVSDEWMDVDTAIEEGTVDVWVANDSGCIVKLSMAFVGKDWDGQPADATFELLVFDVNEPIEVLPPPDDEIIREE